jgi:hypothetical protein
MTNPFLFPILACCLSGIFLALSLCLLARKSWQIVSVVPPPAPPDLTPALDQLRARVSELEQRPVAVSNWNPDMPINLNRRGQVLRLLGRGDQPSEVAGTLGISQGEVLLMLKVHQLTRSAAEPRPEGAEISSTSSRNRPIHPLQGFASEVSKHENRQ